MKCVPLYTALLGAVALAAPTRRADAPSGPSDADILNYALTLEHLEDTFYRQGLANFTVDQFKAAGFDAETYNRIKTVSSDEKTHVSFLTTALTAAGATPVAECTYAFGVTDVKSFLATASVLEGVGVSAYLGAAASIMSKAYLTAAGSILTVEARHSSYIRNTIGQNPFAQPFDAPLDFNEVYTLAAQFITGCPSTNPPLPVKAFPVLTATSTDSVIKTNSTITLTITGAKTKAKLYAAFITVTGPIFVETKKRHHAYEVKIPSGVAGESYVVLTSCEDQATDDYIVAGPAIVEISDS